MFDKKSSKFLKKEADILTTTGSCYEYTIKKAKSQGTLVVVESGSSHAFFQNEIVGEEYKNFGIPYSPFQLSDKRIFDDTLKSYEIADYIAIPSNFAKKTFLEKGIPEEKLIYVPYGVDLSEFRQVEKQDDVFRVVFAGGMNLRKGVHYLLQGFSELNLPNSELVFLGTVNDEIKPFFRKYSVRSSDKFGNGDKEILYLGHKPQRELYKYYSQCSVFVIMSIQEGLALVQPQAMACGLPVICTTNTGGEDIIRDGKDGYIIPIRDVDALKEKILYLYENPEEREKMSKSARERVSTGFTWDDYGDRIVKEYERILNSKNQF